MQPLIRASGIVKTFVKRDGGVLRALDGVSLDFYPGEVLGLVGESGCGKSTLGKCLIRAIEPDEGEILLSEDGQTADIAHLNAKQLRPHRKRMQMVFQDMWSSLNPRMTAEEIISEPLVVGRLLGKKQIHDRVIELVNSVGLSPKQLTRYPHAFSGGQRQRIGIARAIATSPDFLVCDEAVSALDVSVRAQILNLLADLNQQMGLSILFITHDISVVRYISDRIAVMYLGHIVELGGDADIFENTAHPYTRALLAAVPRPDPDIPLAFLEGEAKENAAALEHLACPFYPRCIRAQELCREENPPLREITPGHFAACHFTDSPPQA